MSKTPKAEQDTANATDPRVARQQKLAALRALGIDPFAPNTYDVTAKAADLHIKYAELPIGEVTENMVRVAGRIGSIRNNGMFIDLRDDRGRIQIYSDIKGLPENITAVLALLDLGDWIGVEGIIRRTPRGELTINLAQLTVLGKAMIPPPEKYHGLTDVDTRYRHREQDLVANDESRTTLRARYAIIAAMRQGLAERGFLEVETPMLHVIPGGANARPFTTHHNTLDMPLYLRIAPELHLKRLIIGGIADKVFEINRCFRNEGLSPKHNPEFTTMESYEAFTDYHGTMKLTEELIAEIAQHVFGKDTFSFMGHELIIQPPFRQKTMCELVREITGIDFLQIDDLQQAKDAAKSVGVHVADALNWGTVVAEVFGEKVEHTLIQPIHVTELPTDISPLAQPHRRDPRVTERHETYINGWEIANGFSELSDPAVQRARFEAQVSLREQGDDEAQFVDEDFLTALELGLPATGGLGIGVDRLAMILTGAETIREVIAFPTMRLK